MLEGAAHTFVNRLRTWEVAQLGLTAGRLERQGAGCKALPTVSPSAWIRTRRIS